MTQEATTELTPEQIASAEEAAKNGRTADLDEAARKLQAEQQKPKTAEQLTDEKAIADEQAKKDAEAEEATKKAAEEEANKNKDWHKEWIEVGNDHADAAIQIMKAKGLSPVEGNAIFEEAIKDGDISKIKWDVLQARLNDPSAFLLIKTGIENYYQTEYKEQQELVSYAHDAVGGKDNWDKIKAWAEKTSGSDTEFAKERAEWQRAIKFGGFAARVAVDTIRTKYEASNGSINPSVVRGDKQTPKTEVQGEPLSRRAYFEAIQKAGGDRAPAHVIKSLNARREAGSKLGL